MKSNTVYSNSDYTASKVRNSDRVRRVLELILHLREWQTIRSCAETIEVNNRTVHRYFNLLGQLGFKVEVSHKKVNHYRVGNLSEFFGLE